MAGELVTQARGVSSCPPHIENCSALDSINIEERRRSFARESREGNSYPPDPLSNLRTQSKPQIPCLGRIDKRQQFLGLVQRLALRPLRVHFGL